MFQFFRGGRTEATPPPEGTNYSDIYTLQPPSYSEVRNLPKAQLEQVWNPATVYYKNEAFEDDEEALPSYEEAIQISGVALVPDYLVYHLRAVTTGHHCHKRLSVVHHLPTCPHLCMGSSSSANQEQQTINNSPLGNPDEICIINENGLVCSNSRQQLTSDSPDTEINQSSNFGNPGAEMSHINGTLGNTDSELGQQNSIFSNNDPEMTNFGNTVTVSTTNHCCSCQLARIQQRSGSTASLHNVDFGTYSQLGNNICIPDATREDHRSPYQLPMSVTSIGSTKRASLGSTTDDESQQVYVACCGNSGSKGLNVTLTCFLFVSMSIAIAVLVYGVLFSKT